MKNIRLYDIEWDTEDEDGDEELGVPQEALGLPSEYTVQVYNHWNPEEDAADLLSDNFGYCVKGCKWELA